MNLGAFSISLAVKDLAVSQMFWDQQGNALEEFTDVRELQHQLKAQEMTLASEADEDSAGPASFVAVDPDGNPILVDQHV